ncbi:hypothetical protein HO133_005229 [Letharia lupina]|uniref:Ribosomal protein S17 n=1 Tax=Letharia lupina TaxID=560253 RepID=A0A8H6C9E7_9LECA|nr:uncharacterized protein HO133_005229 [Letharia lupina]KAF6219403.1 hypothetical protein HO133_005229 [Letharia lupina]
MSPMAAALSLTLTYRHPRHTIIHLAYTAMFGPPPKVLCGVVVSAGKMMKAVKVRTAKQTYNKFLKKHFRSNNSYLVSDPNSSLRAGDVVKIAAERRISRHIKHVVTEIVAPWGPSIDERPPVLSEEERLRRLQEKTLRKKERRRERNAETGESAEDRVEGMVEGTAVAS